MIRVEDMQQRGKSMGDSVSLQKTLVSQWVASARDEADTDDYLGKRLLPRYNPWPEPLELEIDGQIINARGRDICHEGVGFISKVDLPRGSMIRIRPAGEEHWVPVQIRHSTSTIGGYKIGANFVFPS